MDTYQNYNSKELHQRYLHNLFSLISQARRQKLRRVVIALQGLINAVTWRRLGGN